MKTFWNDNDGLSITDVLAILFAVGYFYVTWIFIGKLRADTLKSVDVDFFAAYSYGMLVILGGYFGRNVVAGIGKLPIFNRGKDPESTREEEDNRGSESPI
ncbi:hypothetical protein G3578_10165 [Brevibacillus sp. SYP-B805]|uniref:hypothetical protein n=1 Tax=Brevibacillus sp. SYP-B805 TaxID=1578199 RepID=UPI0013ED399E|nr:hypothetical protein [Brevibacillus sp. SYP-B805]NGQ95517.1 hypothetical protein [Brevibacillus sp. SYP-B805]